MKQDNAKQAAHDEKLVPLDDRNTPFYNTFLFSADVQKIYMQQFWLTITKILDICQKVQNQEFTAPPSFDSLLEFLLDLGYKGQLKHISDMYVDQMHQPWRTFGAIINRCLSGKTLSNDRLRPSRIGILFTKAIIHHFMTKHKSISIRQGSPYHTVDDDEVLDRLKFINKGDIYQVYGKPIPDTWITDEIKKYEAYKMYFKYSTGLIPLKKGRGKGAQGTKVTIVLKKTTTTSKMKQPKRKLVIYDESYESEGEPQNRLTGRKKRTPRAVVIQEPPSVPVKKTKESSGKLKEVPDETKDKSKAKDDQDDWGSTDEEELLHAYKDKKPKEIMWYSTKEDESDNDAQDESNDEEEEEDEKSIDIENTDDERTDTDDEDMIMGKTEKQEPFHAVKVSVIPETTKQPQTTPPAPPLPAIEIQSTQVPNTKAVKSVVERFTELERAVKELKQNDHSTTILASIRSQVPLVVKEYLGSSLPDAFQKVLRSHTKELKKELFEKRDYMDVIEESVQANVINEVKNFLPNNMEKGDKPDIVLKKRDRGDDQDEEPSAGSNHDDVEQTFNDKVDDAGQPPHTVADETQPDVDPKIPKKNWFKDSPKPEVLDPDWNTIKTIDDIAHTDVEDIEEFEGSKEIARGEADILRQERITLSARVSITGVVETWLSWHIEDEIESGPIGIERRLVWFI
ncbi:hypothetical protein Tco_1166239 [Tanacetum coccineum]